MSTQFDRTAGLGAWDRSDFAMTVEELEIHEAVTAISRLLDGAHVGEISRRALRYAANALQAELRGTLPQP